MRYLPIAALILMSAPLVPLMAQEAEEGAEIFAHYCATCHGAEAKGGGPMAPVLTLQPSDLSSLAARNGGAFPLKRVVERIDGRDPLMSHGSPMPVWGPFFEGGWDVEVETLSGESAKTSRPVANVVAYLMEIQGE